MVVGIECRALWNSGDASFTPVKSGMMSSKVTKNSHHNRVFPLAEGNTSINLSLESSLWPLWKITSYTFVLLGWYKKLPESNRLVSFLRYTFGLLFTSPL